MAIQMLSEQTIAEAHEMARGMSEVEHTCWRCGQAGSDRRRLYVATIGRRHLCPACVQHYRDAGYRVSRYPPRRA